MTLDVHIEALLFFKAEPVKIRELAATLERPEQEIQEALKILEERLAGRGLQLIHKDSSVLLTTAAGTSQTVEKMQKEQLEKSLGKAGLETLSIILYYGPITRSKIDYIRGVNSTYILRTLLVRGLVERSINTRDRREHLYKPTFELLQFLGIGNLNELPDYHTVRDTLEEFANRQEQEEEQGEA